MRKKSFLVVVLSFVLALSSLVFGYGCGDDNSNTNGDICILYTNDVHGRYKYVASEYEDDGVTLKSSAELGYATLAAYKEQMEKDYGEDCVALVDCGDATQGGELAPFTKGLSSVELMNYVGYDFAAIGNHDFDFGIDSFWRNLYDSSTIKLCCNFVEKESKKSLMQAYAIKEFGNVKIGFVGVDTPEALTASNPANFKNDAGVQIYDFLGSTNNQDLYNVVQENVNAVKEKGVDYVVLLAHLGKNERAGWCADDVIKNTKGIDVVLDGHSHSEIAGDKVKNSENKDVVWSSSGNYLNNIGKLTISKNGEIKTELVNYENNTFIKEHAKAEDTITGSGAQKKVADFYKALVAENEVKMNQKAGSTEIDMITQLSKNPGERYSRFKETSMGDFVADAYYTVLNETYAANVDVTFINGGGVAANLEKGDVTYGNLKALHPYGNILQVRKMTGKQIRQELEWGARTASSAGDVPQGGFLQVAGLRYKIDTTVDFANVQGASGTKASLIDMTKTLRVNSVQVWDKTQSKYVDIVDDKTYLVGSIDFLFNAGDDHDVFASCEVALDTGAEDFSVLLDYFDKLGGTMTANSFKFGTKYEADGSTITEGNRIVFGTGAWSN